MNILQITINHEIPVYWLIASVATLILAIAQVYSIAKNMISRIDNIEKHQSNRDLKIEQILEDVAFIKGKLQKT